MSNHPTSFAEWQSYPSTIDPIHVSWLKNAKKSKRFDSTKVFSRPRSTMKIQELPGNQATTIQHENSQ